MSVLQSIVDGVALGAVYALVAVGLAPLSVERAVVELDTLLSAQWKNGMIPHIVFANGVDGYFPGPARWACSARRRERSRTRPNASTTCWATTGTRSGSRSRTRPSTVPPTPLRGAHEPSPRIG